MEPRIKDCLMLVKEMRAAQKAYFANRTHERLEQSKKLERAVDQELKWLLAEAKAPGAQASLLGVGK